MRSDAACDLCPDGVIHRRRARLVVLSRLISRLVCRDYMNHDNSRNHRWNHIDLHESKALAYKSTFHLTRWEHASPLRTPSGRRRCLAHRGRPQARRSPARPASWRERDAGHMREARPQRTSSSRVESEFESAPQNVRFDFASLPRTYPARAARRRDTWAPATSPAHGAHGSSAAALRGSGTQHLASDLGVR